MNPYDHLLADVVAETLEQFAFLFGEPEEEGPVRVKPQRYIEASIGFSGGGEVGTLIVAASADLCREMAGNVLGLEGAEIPSDAPVDAIKELSNILVGSLTARKLGVGVSCALEPPLSRMLTADEMQALAGRAGALRFRIDEHLFVAVLDERKPGS